MSPPEITSLASDLGSIFSDETLCDVKLQGIDGDPIPAVRAILSARSKVFLRMFFGEFTEATLSVVHLGFRRVVISHLVEYCYTDNVSILNQRLCDDLVRDILHVTEAAHFFELRGLETKLCYWTTDVVKQHPSLACTVLDEASDFSSKQKELIDVSWQIIRSWTKNALLPSENTPGGGVLSLRASMIKEVMKDKKLDADELTLFHCIKKWADTDTSQGENDNPECVSNKKTYVKPRQLQAAEAAKNIHLTRISPSYLTNAITTSGLCASQDLLKAYQTQALVLEKEGMQAVFSRLTKMPRSAFFGGLSVIVKNAGVDSVNGTYIFSGMFNKFPEYSKRGFWRNKEEIFYLLRTNMRGSKKHRWWIVIKLNSGGWLGFYCSPFVDGENFIPHYPWGIIKGGEGRKPYPDVITNRRTD